MNASVFMVSRKLIVNRLTVAGLFVGSWLAFTLAFTGVASAQGARSQPNEAANEATTVLTTAEEIPEEILRTEIITGARSPLTGEPISAAEYAQLQAELAASAGDPLVNQQLRYLIFLLQIRRGIQPIIPFL